MKVFIGLALLSITLYSCGSDRSGFGKKTLHEKYAAGLREAGLENTELGRQWFSWAQKSVYEPVLVTLPYSETGYFEASQPRASGLRFTAKRGQKLIFSITRIPAQGFTVFIDCWLIEGQERNGVFTGDSLQTRFEYEVDGDAEFILRLQPELLKGGEYTLSISTGPSLAFPVSGNKARIGSIWGDIRDAGARSHQGIDIFAPKGTPVVAASDGTIRSVTINKLGGKVIFMRPEGKNYSLYYAHLDEQLVSSGQNVREGDTLGLVGNTGNARTTPPHLHFGIYTPGGAIDPYIFVNPLIQKALKPGLKATEIDNLFRLKTSMELITNGGAAAVQYPPNTIVTGFRVNATHLIAILPDGSVSAIPLQKVDKATQLKKGRSVNDLSLLDAPVREAASRRTISSQTDVLVLGYFKEFAYVTVGNDTGWVALSEIK